MQNIDLSTVFLNKRLQYPLVINAITGGTEQAGYINAILARTARRFGLAMAVGSQRVACDHPELRDSFSVVRQEDPKGIIIANLSAGCDPDMAEEAVEMIQADALQLHFNIPQELAMPEGDRNFAGLAENAARVTARLKIPVIAKEVGFGFSREAAEVLFQAGIKHFDVGGKGGTNFVAIENRRQGLLGNEYDNWGIPTAISLAELEYARLPVTLIASGGIRTAPDTVKALAMGADLVGIAGPLLKVLLAEGEEGLAKYMDQYFYRLKAGFLMAGARTVAELQQKPVIILNQTAAWLRARGIDPDYWSQR